MKTLRNLLFLSAFMVIGVAAAFYFKPSPVEQRVALGEQLGGDFEVQATDGSLKLQDFRDQVVVMFFGYTSCPDVCPTSMAVAAQSLHQLSKDEQASVAGIFMSVDPDRDTPERLDKYTAYFHPNFRGVTSDRENIDKVIKQYGAYYRMVDLSGSALGYAVDHTSRLYLIDKQGRLVQALPHTITPAQLTSEIRNLL